jgi:hypothetical protein
MSFMYPRRVRFHRPGAQTGIGAVAYGGQTVAKEDDITCTIPASIQARREGTNNPVGLPGDSKTPTWYVFIPKRAAKLGDVQDRDIMIDDLGNRYQVIQPYWDSLGHRLTAISLNT